MAEPASLCLVRWAQAPLSFELSSSDSAVLTRAEIIFRPWPPLPASRLMHRWRIESVPPWRVGEPGAWAVRSGTESDTRARATVGQALLTVERLAVQALSGYSAGPLMLHGALVARGERGVLLIGRAQSGKSTLACALWQRGFTFFCDDATLVEPETGRARPTPRRVALRHGSRRLLGEGLWARLGAAPSHEETSEGCVFHPHEVDGCARPESVRLAALVLLARPEAATPSGRLVRLVPAHALLALLSYTNLIERIDAGDVIRQLQPLAGAVPCYDLARGPLGRMTAAVERLIEGRHPA